MVGTGILSNNMRSPSPECYTTFWMVTIYSDTLHWSGITPILTLFLILTLLPNLTFYLIARGFHRTFATGAACQQRTLTPPDTWSRPTLGLASVLMLRPISPELVLFLDFWVTNIPRYFCFCFINLNVSWHCLQIKTFVGDSVYCSISFKMVYTFGWLSVRIPWEFHVK